MNLFTKTLAAVSLFFVFFTPAMATHIVGGEMSYVSLGNNRYQVTLTVYRDCSPGITTQLDDPATLTVYNGDNSVDTTLNVRLQNPNFIPLASPNPCLVIPPNACIQQGTYTFIVNLPPKPGGYTIAYQRCCRNSSIVNIIGPLNTGSTYFVQLNDTDLARNNNSPVFKNYPPVVICRGQPLVFDNSAFDPDGDSLVYGLCQPYTSLTTQGGNDKLTPPPFSYVSYITPPYSSGNPMDASQPLAIDPQTGILTVTPSTIDRYVVGVCVSEYRRSDGLLLGEYLRDFQFIVVECSNKTIADLPPELNNCSSDTVNFANNSTSDDTYHWDFGVPGITTDTSNLQYPTFIYPDSGIYFVKLTVNRGLPCSDSTSTHVYIYPTLKASLVSSPLACLNKTASFKDLSVSTYHDISAWKWNFGDTGTSHIQNPAYVYASPGTYTVTLIVTTQKGCMDTAEQKVIVNKATIASTPPSVIQCGGKSVQFKNTSSNATTYFWNFGVQDSTADTSILKNPTYIFPDTGVYKVKLKVADPGTVCVDSTISLVSIYPGFKAGMITPSGCLDVPVLFADTSHSPYGVINSWKWRFGDSDSSAIKDPTHNFPGEGNYTIFLLVKNTKGCMDSITRAITIYPTPQVTDLPKDSAICDKDAIQLFALEEGGVSYKWSPDYNINNDTLPSPFVSPKVTTTYYTSVTDNHGCIGHDSLTVKVFDTVYAHVSNDTVICPGGKAQLTATGFGDYFYWSPQTNLNNPDLLNPVANPGTTTDYTFTEAAGSCKAAVTVSVIIKPVPVINGSDDQNLCFGDTALLSASGGTSYTWQPSESLTSSTGENTRAFPDETTVYYVTGINTTECPVAVYDSITVTVIHPEATLISTDTTIIDGTYAFPFALGGTAYHWYPAEGVSNPNIFNPRVNPTKTTTYYVNIVTPDGCIATDSVVITVVPEPIIKFPTAFSPNGDGKNDYYHPITVGPLSNYEFRIYNRWGQLVYSSNNQNDIGWDGTFKGKLQDAGVFDYYFEGASVETGQQFKNKGNITLLR